MSLPPVVIDASYLEAQRRWSTETFGPGPRTQGIIDHIKKEFREIEAKPDDLEEWVDVIILALDGAQRLGVPVQDIIDGVHAKLSKNMQRSWPDWRTAEEGKAIEHKRTPGEVLTGLVNSGADEWVAAFIVSELGNGGARNEVIAALVLRGLWQSVAEEMVDRAQRELGL